MGFYENLDEDLNGIKTKLYTSQNFAKLMTVPNDPLSPTTPNIDNIPYVLNSKIDNAYILPVEGDTDCKLIILFTNFEPVGGKMYMSCIIDFNILVHKDWWKIKGKTRAFQIAGEIDKLLTTDFKFSMGGLQRTSGRGYFEVANGNPYKGFNIRYRSMDFSR